MHSPLQSPLQPVMRSPLEFRRRGGGGGFNPVSAFFGAGEQGVIYDLSVMSSLFQDSAGTVPVTAVDQPVGKILDLSGNGNHATQPTAGKLPLLKTDGTYWWLEGDAVDDCMYTDLIDLSAVSRITAFCGSERTDANERTVFDFNSGFPGGFKLVSDYGISNSIGFIYGGSASSSFLNLPNAKDVPSVTTYQVNASAFSASFSVNGGAVASSSGAPNANFTNDRLTLLSHNSRSSGFFGGKFFSLIIRGAATDAEGISNGNAWTAARCGVTL